MEQWVPVPVQGGRGLDLVTSSLAPLDLSVHMWLGAALFVAL